MTQGTDKPANKPGTQEQANEQQTTMTDPEQAQTGKHSGTLDSGALQEALARAEARAEEYHDQLLRARAEVENMRRRTEREIANIHKYATEKFAAEILPIKDSLELALDAMKNETVDIDKVREGLELKIRMLDAVLGKFGIKEVNPVGEKFNPEFHEAMTVAAGGESAPNTVLTVHQKGYLIHDRLIRPAMVVVSGAAPNNNSRPPDNAGSSGVPSDGRDPQNKIDEMA